jgi:hypothetical protein
MSGVTKVRLYRNTIHNVLENFINITAAVLNSSTKDHTTGMEMFLDGVATVDGHQGDITYCFWVEVIDTRGNTSGPHMIGSLTTPTVWNFYVAHE